MKSDSVDNIFGPRMAARTLILLFLAALVFPLHALAQTDADFFDTSKLQEIRLEIRPGDWALLKQNFLDNTYYACDFHWIFNGKDITLPEIAIRSRGQD